MSKGTTKEFIWSISRQKRKSSCLSFNEEEKN